MRSTMISAAFAAALLVSCKNEFVTEVVPDEGSSPSSVEAMATSSIGGPAMVASSSMGAPEKAPAPVMAKGSYAAYRQDVIGNGQQSVLFFHAAWCPVCKIGDQKLTAWYAANSYPVSTYKVDYDASAELKERYGVTYQHTFVLIDGKGNALKTVKGPTDAQLQSMLSI